VSLRIRASHCQARASTVTFKYDPFGRRIEKISPTTTSTFAYDGDSLVETVNGSGGVVARYTLGQNLDEPLAMERGSTMDYYEADGLGSITSLTASNGTVAQSYTYDSFGNTTNSSGSLTNFFRYSGREFDTETNLYYDRARYLDPTTGRFISEDPIGFKGGANFYRYVRNNAVNLTDPTGHTLQGFPPAAAAQMSIAIGQLAAKLKSHPCVGLRRSLVRFLSSEMIALVNYASLRHSDSRYTPGALLKARALGLIEAKTLRIPRMAGHRWAQIEEIEVYAAR
jgi:RHS repeat-associated protein